MELAVYEILLASSGVVDTAIRQEQSSVMGYAHQQRLWLCYLDIFTSFFWSGLLLICLPRSKLFSNEALLHAQTDDLVERCPCKKATT